MSEGAWRGELERDMMPQGNGVCIALREVRDDDLPVFFEHQLDPEANRMAAFTAKDPSDRAAFDARWSRIRRDPHVTIRTILLDGTVAGHVAVYGPVDKREVTYWVGRDYWGKGIATAALARFLREVPDRPLFASAAHDNVASRRVLEKCGFTVCAREKAFANARGTEIEEVFLKLQPQSA